MINPIKGFPGLNCHPELVEGWFVMVRQAHHDINPAHPLI